MPRFSPLEFLKNIQEHKVTIFCIVPAMFMALLSLKEQVKLDLSTLQYAVVFRRTFFSGCAQKFSCDLSRARLANGWGMTETAAPNTISPAGDAHVRSIGRFTAAMQAKIVDQQGKNLSRDEQGELMGKG